MSSHEEARAHGRHHRVRQRRQSPEALPAMWPLVAGRSGDAPVRCPGCKRRYWEVPAGMLKPGRPAGG